MAVSNHCHKKIHRDIKWATKKGYLLQRNTKTEKQPIMKKATAATLIIFLISIFAMSFSQKPLAGFVDPTISPQNIQLGLLTDTTKKNIKQDTAYYISNTLPWFQLLFKTINTPDSVDQFQKTALLSWIMTVRPILPLDTTTKKETTPPKTQAKKPKSQ